MKYIRTKDGIMNISQTNVLFVKIDGKYKMISRFKQADTIEELCDEFIGVVGNMHRQLTGTNIRSWNDCSIYGAIWTEWGLKYVAKMNDKGELELL